MILRYGIIFALFVLSTNSGIHSKDTNLDLEREIAAEQNAIRFSLLRGYISEIESTFADQVKREFNLLRVGDYSMVHNKIEIIGMKFIAKRRATIEEARALQVLVMNKLVQAINTHEKIQPYLDISPITYKRIKISIAFENHYGRCCDGYVSRISNVSETATAVENRNKIFYYYDDPYQDRSIDILGETYEEAVKLNLQNPIENPGIHPVTEKEETLDKIFDLFLNDMRKEFGLYGHIGGKLTGDIEEIGAKFTAFQALTQEDTRQLLLHVTERVLADFNGNEKLKPYLKEIPFPSNRIKIRIDFSNQSDVSSTIKKVTLDGDEITYTYNLQNEPEGQITDLTKTMLSSESYQEALKKFDNSPEILQKLKPKPRTFLDDLYDFSLTLLYYILMLFNRVYRVGP